MTAVKISDFNEPMNSLSLVHEIKSEDESEEEQHPNRLREATSSSTNASNKRYNWVDYNEEDRQPAKKRYRFE